MWYNPASLMRRHFFGLVLFCGLFWLCFPRIAASAYSTGNSLPTTVTPSLSPIPTAVREQPKQGKRLEYELPYPGILPDHPLYKLKVLRDRIVIFFTKDPRKRVQLYVLLADKRLAMGEKLVERQREQLAAETISKGEKYLLGAVEILRKMSDRGDYPDVGLVNAVDMSVAKHREVINRLHDTVVGDAKSSMGLSLQLVDDVDRELKVFKKTENIGM